MDFYTKYLKRKIIRTEIIGIVSALAGIGYILFYYFNLVNQWMCAIMICYIIAINFMVNSTYQEIFSGVKLSKVNLAVAILFLLATVALIVFSILQGKLQF